MPAGIILSSGSVGATPEAVQKVFTDNGLEVDKPEPPEIKDQKGKSAGAGEPAEAPKRDDFDNEDDYQVALEAHEVAEAEREEREAAKAEEEEEDERQGRQERRHKVSRRQRAVDRATAALQEELRQMRDKVAALEGKGGKPAAAPAAPAAPKREDFKSDEDYANAMFDHRYKLRRAQEQVEEAKRATEAHTQQSYETYKAGVAEFKADHDDWDEVVGTNTPIHQAVQLAIIEQENGPEVTYYLGKHPAYARKLAGMSPLAAVMEVGRLSERLKTGAPDRGEADSGHKPKPRARVPEPVKPLNSSATSSTLTSREAAKNRDFKAFKQAQRRGV